MVFGDAALGEVAGDVRTVPLKLNPPVAIRSALLECVDPADVRSLVARARPRMFRRGQVAFQRGDEADGLYVIVSGEFRILLEGAKGKEYTLSVIGPGDVLGDLPLLDGMGRTATAIASTPVQSLFVSAHDFDAWLVRNPQAVRAIAVGLARPADAGSPPNAAEEVAQGQAGAGFARHPLFVKVHGYAASRSPVYVNGVPHGYTPQQIRAYLGLSGDGAGQTIGVVDAYDDPNIESDVNTFSATFGLPLICGSAGADAGSCFNFTKVAPQGKTRADAGWALEIALDVEWAHAVAPKANILLVETKSNGLNNLFAGIDYAAQHGASVISNSWGATEYSSEVAYDASCNLAAAVCTFAGLRRGCLRRGCRWLGHG